MFDDAKDFFKNVSEDIDDLGDKVMDSLFKDLPTLIKKWNFKSRELTPHEINEARRVFGSRYEYDEVRVFEGNELPNFLDDIGNVIKKMPKRADRVKNAITLGNWVMFGRDIDTTRANDMTWMIHELTHAWQYQTMGWDYLFQALDAQKNLGAAAYDFGGEEGLKTRAKKGAKFTDFNMEQQGDITKDYYRRLIKGEDTSTWDPFIQEVRGDRA